MVPLSAIFVAAAALAPAQRARGLLDGVFGLSTADQKHLETAVSKSGVFTAADLASPRGPRLMTLVFALPTPVRDRLVKAILDWLDELTFDSARPRGPRPTLMAVADSEPAFPVDAEGVERWAAERGVADLLDLKVHEIRALDPSRSGLDPLAAFLTVREALRPDGLVAGAPASHRARVERLHDAIWNILASASSRRASLRAERAAFVARRLEPETAHEQAFDRALSRLPETSNEGLPILGYPADRVSFQRLPSPTLTVQLGLRVGHIATPTVTIDVQRTIDGAPRAAAPTSSIHDSLMPQVLASAVAVARDALRDPASDARTALAAWLAVPSWKRLIDAMTSSAIDSPVEEGRLAFRLAHDPSPERFAIDILLQAKRKNGHYSAGRVIDFARALSLATEPIDTRVLDELWAWRSAPMAGEDVAERRLVRLLTVLAEHPRVVLGDGRLASIRRARLGITVEAIDSEQDERRHRLRLSVGDVPREPAALAAALGETGLLLDLDPRDATLRIVQLDAPTCHVVTALATTQASFPDEALAALLAVLQGTQGGAELHLPDALRGRAIAGDAATVARVSPVGASGLRVELVVRPIAAGPAFEPGAGPAVLLGTANGARVSAHRRLEDERERAERLLADLPLGDAERDGPWAATVTEMDRAADVLVALAESQPPARVEWPQGAPISLVKAERRHLKLRIERRHDWFGVEGELTVDDAQVALVDLLAAARAGHRFVRLGPTRIVALARDLRERLAAADDALLARGKDLEAPALALPALDALVEDTAQIKAAVAWTKMRATMARASTLDPAVPSGLAAELRPYQREGFQWLARISAWGAGGCLADDMGLGKTVQTLALLLHRASEGPALVVAPTTVGPNWLAEANRFAPSLRVRPYRGPERGALLTNLGPGDVLVTSYDLVTRDAEALAAITFATLVLDEAQAVKNASSRRAAAARGLSADVRIALSGTPIENHLGELWSIFRIVSPGLLGGWERFRERFAGPIELERDPVRQAALARLMRPFLLRRTKREVAPDLPARTETVRLVELSGPERARYEAERLATVMVAEGSDPETSRFAVLAAITRLRRLACHPRLVDEASTVASSKLAAFLELVEELRDSGHRALVFSQFTSHLALVREALDASATPYLYLDGSTPSGERERLVRAFQAGEGDLFLLSLKAGGTGINLTAADYVVHLDPWWNPAAEDQATDRAHRIGQSRPVTVVRLVSQGTIEEGVLSLHEEKRALAESLLAGGELAGALSAAELVALVKRGEEVEGGHAPNVVTPSEGKGRRARR